MRSIARAAPQHMQGQLKRDHHDAPGPTDKGHLTSRAPRRASLFIFLTSSPSLCLSCGRQRKLREPGLLRSAGEVLEGM